MVSLFKRLLFSKEFILSDLHLKTWIEKKSYRKIFICIICYRNNHGIRCENDKIKIIEKKRLKNVLTTAN